MLGYTRRQLILLAVVVAVGAAGLAVDRWRRTNPDVAAYLEALDRAAPPPAAAEPPGRRARSRAAARAGSEPRAAHARAARGDDAAPLDLNRASAEEFGRLPGVGPALAARIVDARARAGPFESVDDLRRVRGVGRVTLERLRPLLAVSAP
jgi:competence protein ComEA